MIKLGAILVKHKEKTNHWKGAIGQKIKIEEKVLANISKGEGHLVYQFMNSLFSVSMGQHMSMLTWGTKNAHARLDNCQEYRVSTCVQ